MRKRTTKRKLRLLSTAALLTLIAGTASAIGTPPIERLRYELEQGIDSGFRYSGLHDANDSTPMSGQNLASFYGSLTFDYDPAADLYTLISSDVHADNGIDFAFVAGQITGDGAGFLDYILSGTPDFAPVARILFTGGASVCCGIDGPNYIDRNQLRLWGASDVGEGNGRIGVDLGGSATALPEPSSAVLFALGVLLLRVTRRVA